MDYQKLIKKNLTNMKQIIRNTRGRNRSKEPTEFWYYLFVCAVGVIVGVAVVDLVVNFRIV